MENLTGRVVGHYRLANAIDEAGVAPVYRAQHIHYDRPAAVKIFTTRLSEHPTLRARFQATAQTLTQLRHESLVRTTDFIVEDELVAVAMALLDAESLDQELIRRAAPYSADEALSRILPVADALTHAHSRGGVHGGLTPSKVMLSYEQDKQRVRVLGFGVASVLGNPLPKGQDDHRSDPRWYLSPEQCRTPSHFGPAADQYALAAILYQLLTGQAPCVGDSDAEILDAHRHAIPTSPETLTPGLPNGLAELVVRALAKNPEGRWTSMDAFASALRESIPTPVATVPPPTHRQVDIVAPVEPAPAPPAAQPPTPMPTPVATEADQLAAVHPAMSVHRVAPPNPAAQYPPGRAQAMWSAEAPPPNHAHRNTTILWVLILAFVAAGSAAVAVYALLSTSDKSVEKATDTAQVPAGGGSAQPAASPPAPPRSPDAAVQKVPIPLPGPGPTAGLPRTGSAACDRYLRAYKCYIDKMPAAVHGPALKALRKTAEAYRKMAASPAVRGSVETSCNQAYDALARAMGNLPQAQGCFTVRPAPRPLPQPQPQPQPKPPSQTIPLQRPATTSLGVASCDAYLRMYRCFLNKIPSLSKAALQKTYDNLLKSWKRAASTPAGKIALDRACVMAASAFRKSLAGNPTAKGCLKK